MAATTTSSSSGVNGAPTMAGVHVGPGGNVGVSGPPMGTSTGSGQDFILFDDWTGRDQQQQQQQQQTPGAGPWFNSGRSAAFMDHRGGSGSATGSGSAAAGTGVGGATFAGSGNGGQQGGAAGINANTLAESPFSSPASKPDDDTVHLNHPPNSGTLASSTATPNRKRARNHGYSSSWQGGSINQHVQQQRQASNRNSLSGGSESGGWSGSDTSPKNPPSGSFGPPIHSLSLGDDGTSTSPSSSAMRSMASADNAMMPSLFPTTTTTMPAMSSSAAVGMNQQLQQQQQQQQPGWGSNFPTPLAQTPQLQQNERQPSLDEEQRARQQVQADLAGVDSRALRGPLRDIQQQGGLMAPALGGGVTSASAATAPASTMPSTSASTVQPSTAASQPPTTLAQQQQNLLFPRLNEEGSTASFLGSSVTAPQSFNTNASQNEQQQPKEVPKRPGQPRRRSGSFDSSFLLSSDTPMMGNFDFGQNGAGAAGSSNGASNGYAFPYMGWTGQPTNNFNAFDLQGLDLSSMLFGNNQSNTQAQQQQQLLQLQMQQAGSKMQNQANGEQFGATQQPPSQVSAKNAPLKAPVNRFSTDLQRAIDRATAQKPVRRPLTRDRSGLTISPQEAFLDYDSVESAMQASGAAPMQSLFATAPLTVHEALARAQQQQQQQQQQFAVTSKGGVGRQIEGTPSLVGGGSNSSASNSGSRETSTMTSSPPTRAPLGRTDTAKPSLAQKHRLDAQASKMATSHSAKASNRELTGETSTRRGSEARRMQKDETSASLQSQDSGEAPPSLFSPSESTASSTDDEDERPYISGDKGSAEGASGPTNRSGWTSPFRAQRGGSLSEAMGGSLATTSSSSSTSPDPKMADARKSQQGSAMPTGGIASAAGDGSSTSESGAWAHVKRQPWASSSGGQAPPPQMSGPRFSVVSSSSSESEDEAPSRRRGGGKTIPGHPSSGSSAGNYGDGQVHPSQRMVGGYNYMPNSNESGLSIGQHPSLVPEHRIQVEQQQKQQQQQKLSSTPGNNSAVDQQSSAIHHKRSSDAQSESQQSQDDNASLSPSIRSSAKPVVPGMHPSTTAAAPAVDHGPHHNQPRGSFSSSSASSSAAESDDWETGEDEEEEEDNDDDDDDYGKPRMAPSARGGASTRGRRGAGGRKRKGAPARPRAGNIKDAFSSAQATANSSGAGHAQQQQVHQQAHASNHGNSNANNSHLTLCDYVSPLTGEVCGVGFHRPYDLARHRETIHARDEANLVRQGRITPAQCIVLHKEVDPSKSMATQEWRCDGKNGCGSVFSRKDALLRHRRIRGH